MSDLTFSVEKQVPKELKDVIEYKNFKIGVCPNCETITIWIPDGNNVFCNKCGQCLLLN